jgi:hypothetical protein
MASSKLPAASAEAFHQLYSLVANYEVGCIVYVWLCSMLHDAGSIIIVGGND